MNRLTRFSGLGPTLAFTLLTAACGQGGANLEEGAAEVPGERLQAATSTQSLSPTADGWVVAGSPTTNYGADTELRTKQLDSSSGRRAFLQFNLGGLSGNVTSARLRLSTTYSQAGATLDVAGVADDSWTEAGLTWNTQPAAGAVLANAVAAPAAGAWLDVDVTSFVAQQAGGDKVASFTLTESSLGHDTNFASREYATSSARPVLVVTTETVTSAPSYVADPSQYLRDPYPAGLTVVSANPSNLASVLLNAKAGQIIELATGQGNYTGSFELGPKVGASLSSPIIVRSKAGGRARFTGRFTLSGTASALDGLEFSGANAQVLVQGTRNRVTRTRFLNKPFNSAQYKNTSTGWTAQCDEGSFHHWDHNEFANIGLWGLRLNSSPGPRAAWVERNYWHDWETPRDSEGKERNSVECLQVGGGKESMPEPFGAIVEYNLFERVTLGDDETISVKSSNNTLAFNTIRQGNRFQNRGGTLNRWISNWSKSSSGLYLNCKGTVAVGNHIVDGSSGILVQMGSYDWDNPGDYGGMCRAENVLVAGNWSNRTIVGDDTYEDSVLDVIGTKVEEHHDDLGAPVNKPTPVLLVLTSRQSGTTLSPSTTQVVPPARELTAADVGP